MPDNDLTGRQQFVLVVLAAVVVGALLSPVVFSAASGPPDTVAVVEIEGPIVSSLADDVETELGEIRQNDSVKAVVLKMDTPGGAPAASERMYMSVQRTAEEMPVVASVQQVSASGGYYAMLPAETIYVLPTSITGSVGLAAGAPRPNPPVRGPSGPNKRGGNVIGQWALQETLADTFISTVMEQRDEELEVSRSKVAHAKVYLGTEAVGNGFADKIGSVDEAVREAADRAELDGYRVDTREPGQDGRFPFLVRTDTRIVAVYANDPGYGQVKPMHYAYVYEGAVPHLDAIEQVSRSDIRTGATNDTTGQTAARATTGGENS